MTKDWRKSPVSVGNLKYGVATVAPVLSVNIYKAEDGLDGAEEWVLCRREGNFVDISPVLIVFTFRDRDDNPLTNVVVQRRDILPTEDEFQVNGLFRSSNQVRRPQHR